MLYSQLFIKTKKQVPKEAEVISHKLLIKGDFIEQVASGIYTFLPLGLRVLRKIKEIIKEEMDSLAGQELLMPSLIPKNLWLKTDRWEKIEPPLFKLKDQHQKAFGLGSTHEEVITQLVEKRVNSYKDLPLYLYQIQDKFRNEIRATGGLLRTREFLMKDLYSFHISEKDLANFYEKVKKSYFKIFKKCGLKVICVEASTGTIGGKLSHEFMVLSDIGEDRILVCKKCKYSANIEKIGKVKVCPKCKGLLEKKSSIEIGHIFNLGIKYSKIQKANYIDKNGKSQPIIMGCYGIGLPRIMAAIIEIHHDEKGILWPKSVAPFDIHLMNLGKNPRIKKVSKKLYKDLSFLTFDRGGQKANIEVLYDDREEKTVGEKFSDADLIGIPYRIVVSERTIAKNCVEIKKRDERKTRLVKIKQLPQFLKINIF